MKEPLVSRSAIAELLFGDEDYVDQFIDASIDSFTEFRDNFTQFMQDQNLQNLRRAGHKIKPVAQIMNLGQILEMYEHSKDLLDDDAPKEQISESIDRMRGFCNQLIEDLKSLK